MEERAETFVLVGCIKHTSKCTAAIIGLRNLVFTFEASAKMAPQPLVRVCFLFMIAATAARKLIII